MSQKKTFLSKKMDTKLKETWQLRQKSKAMFNFRHSGYW